MGTHASQATHAGVRSRPRVGPRAYYLPWIGGAITYAAFDGFKSRAGVAVALDGQTTNSSVSFPLGERGCLVPLATSEYGAWFVVLVPRIVWDFAAAICDLVDLRGGRRMIGIRG